MTDTQHLIDTLSSGAQPVQPAGSPLAMLVRWLIVSLLYVAAIALSIHLRVDLAAKLQEPLFLSEVLSLAALSLTAAIASAFLAFPDMYRRAWLRFVPLVPLLAFLITLYMEWLADSPPAPPPPHGLDCLVCITALTLIPAAFMLLLARRRASVHSSLTGGMALLAAASLGCLTLRLAEDTNSVMHLVQWHYLPMFAFGTIGLLLGRKFLKW